jgi:molecular chaperone GrpE
MGTERQNEERAPSVRPPNEVKVVDRRWWARDAEGDAAVAAEPASLKPSYVEELEQRLAEKDRLLQGYIEQFKAATADFEQSRLRVRREVARDVERGRRALLVDLLEILDNLDRALDAASGQTSPDALAAGVRMVRDQFLARLEANGIREIQALDQPFDPSRHEAVSVVPAPEGVSDDRVAGVIRRGFTVGDEVLRPALVAVARRS